jgi:hypothetical protein
VQIALMLYALGVAIGLLVMRDRFVTRLVTALLWPLGPIAGIAVVAGLLVVAAILWPVLLVGAALVGGAVYLLV